MRDLILINNRENDLKYILNTLSEKGYKRMGTGKLRKPPFIAILIDHHDKSYRIKYLSGNNSGDLRGIEFNIIMPNYLPIRFLEIKNHL